MLCNSFMLGPCAVSWEGVGIDVLRDGHELLYSMYILIWAATWVGSMVAVAWLVV